MPTALRKVNVKSKLKKDGKREIVGQAEFNEYDDLKAAIEGVGEKEALRLINVQVKTNAMNAVRAAATQKPTKQSLFYKALQTIPSEELAALQAAGDPAKMEARVKQEIEKLEREYDEQRSANVAAATAAADDADDEDDDEDEEEDANEA